MSTLASDYIVLFDVLQEPYAGWPQVVFTLGMAVATGFWSWTADTIAVRILTGICSVAFAVGALVWLASTWSEHNRLTDVARSHVYAVVEGPVQDFVSDRDNGGGPQTFVVEGQRFEMWRADATSAFSHTMMEGGPNLAGRCVRVHYTEHKEIVWMAMLRRSCPVTG